jgi:amino acid transporter
MALEGGLYQWAKLGFNDFMGFLVGWNLWLYVILIVATLGLVIAANLAYALDLESLATNKLFILVVICSLVGLLTLVTTLGLGVGKWFQSAGGIAQMIAFAILIAIPFLGLHRDSLREYRPLAFEAPALSLLSLNIFGKLSMGAFIPPLVILLLIGRQIGNSTLSMAGSTRLPMVAGWDHLLPQWFAKLHPKYKTPVNSVLFVGALVLALSLLGLTGVGQQEAFQLLENSAGIFYGLTYLALFALPVLGFRASGQRPPFWLTLAATSGFLVTLLYCVLSLFPIIQVESWLSFGLKIGGVIGGANLLGASLYWIEKRKRAYR